MTNPVKYRFYFLALLTLLRFASFAQIVSTEGEDFWFGFMNNYDSRPISLEIYISAKDSTSGVLDMPGIGSFQPVLFEVEPGVTTQILLEQSVAMAAVSAGIEAKGIHIYSADPISVFAMNKRETSADAAVIFPTFSLSNEYLVMSHWEDGNRNNNNNSNSEFLIVATTDDTEVLITPTVTTLDGQNAGEAFELTLDAGETYQVMARGDLTGSSVIGINNSSGECSSFALFAGNQYTQVGECGVQNGHDHLFAQQYPLKTWGREFITVNYEPREGGDLVKILAQEDGTLVTVDGETITIDEGNFVTYLLDGVNLINASKPIAVGQFSRTQECDGVSGDLGDPFFILLSPNEQLLSEITFNSPRIVTTSSFSLNIIAPSVGLNALRLDGDQVADQFLPVPGKPEFQYARFSISGGNHTILSEQGFIAYVYAYGYTESFGYSAGVGLSNLSLGVQIKDLDGAMVPLNRVCHDERISFIPVSEDVYDYFSYDFGDGTTTTASNSDPVFHSYDSSGTYVFTLTGVFEESTCLGGNEQREVRVLKVVNPQLKIAGPRSVCPFTEEVTYTTKNAPGYSNKWNASGGSVVKSFGDSVHITWGSTNNDAAVHLVSSNRDGCPGDTVVFPVRVNPQLEPSAPAGIDTLCSNDMSGITYEAYYFNGSVYDWGVDGGKIMSGRGERRVTVDWESHGIGKLWFLQSVPGEDICEGTSDTLFVQIQRFPEPELTIEGVDSVYQVGQRETFSVATDTLYRFLRWSVNDQVVADSVSLDFELIYDFTCTGFYKIEALAYDTAGFCAGSAGQSIQVSVEGPKPRILNVTNDTTTTDRLLVNWAEGTSDYGDFSYTLTRSLDGRIVTTIMSADQPLIEQNGVETGLRFFFQVAMQEVNCEELFGSDIHNNVVLTGIDRGWEEQVSLEWTPYKGWAGGVKAYELYLSVDGRPYSQIYTGTDERFDFMGQGEGFDHCFRVRAIEEGGNQMDSWSNEVCIFFEPELHAHNVFTPNNDEYNPYFIIENVEVYKKSVLTVTDRQGNKVYETRNYQNNWDGGKLPPA